MSFDFLPDNKPPNPQQSEGKGGAFNVGKNVFFDNYTNHLDAHALFSTPPKRSEFTRIKNYEIASLIFSEEKITDRIKSNFYGSKTTAVDLINGYTLFQDPKLLNDTLNNVNAEINQDLFSALQKPKMKINDRFGMFSFDLAAMAMTYVYDYYTIKDNLKVDASYVEKRKEKFFSTKLNKEVKQVVRRHKNGNPVVVSSVRNCLIDFEKQDKQERSVELMVSNSYGFTEKPEKLIYNSMAAISVAKNLVLKGFRVKLTSLIITSIRSRNYYHLVPAKLFNQPLDINAAAYICGDPRFFRHQGFKMIISGCDRDNVDVIPSLGSIISDTKSIAKVIEKDYVPNSGLKQADTRLYFGGARTIDMVKKEVETALDILNEKYT